MALKFAMILEAVDRMSGPARRASAGARNLAKGARELAREGGPAARSMDRVSSAAGRMRARLGTALTRVRALAGRAGMKALEKSAYGAGYAIGWTIRKVATLAGGLAKLAAGSAVIGGGAFLGGVITTAAKFEQFQVVLEGVEGSAEKAKASMKWVQEFAEKTPYELDQVMEAFVRLKTYGIDPMDGTLRSAGDAASAMGKDIMQAVEAIADAQTGEMERLKELGITVRREGGKIRMIYSKNNQEMQKVVSDNRVAIREGVTGIWNDLFGGGMERQSKTFNGLMSNLKDRWTGFMLKVGQAGIFDKVKAKLEGFLSWLDKKLADGSIEKWAQNVSDELKKVVDWVSSLTESDWSGFLSSLKTAGDGFLAIGKGAAWAAKKVAELIAWNDRVGARNRAAVLENAEQGWFTSEKTKREARNERRTIEREYGPLTETGRKEAGQASTDYVGGYLKKRKELDRRGPATPRSQRASPINLRGAPISARTSPAPQKVAVGGTMEVKLTPPPGWSATPTRMTTANPAVPVVFRGGANRGFG